MKGHQRLKPVDLISYLALLALILTTLVIQPPHGTALLLKYGGLALVLTLLWWMDQGRFRVVRGMHAFYPIVFIPILFDSFADLLPWVSSGSSGLSTPGSQKSSPGPTPHITFFLSSWWLLCIGGGKK
jgi:hypothetical protein